MATSLLGPGRTKPISTAAHLTKGGVGGFLAGAVFIAITSWFATTTGKPALAPFQMIATIVQGPQALEAGTASIPLGMAIHSVLSVVFGLILALLMLWVRSNAVLVTSAVLWGGILYLVNFQILGRIAFPPFMTTNQPFELATHVLYGALLGVFLLRRERKVAESFIEEREIERRAA